jgi:membrane-associated phospholipid phosphatase
MLRRSAPILLLAVLCAAALGGLGILAFLSERFRTLDRDALTGFLNLDRPWLDGTLHAAASTADPVPYALAGALLIAVALVRGRRRLAVALPFVLLGSAVATQAVKHVSSSSRLDAFLRAHYVHISEASWPSGHATAAMTLALCATLVAPVAWRPLVGALGALYAIAVSFSILALSLHFPSDVLGGYLMAMLWVLVAIAVLAALEARAPEEVRPRDVVPSLVVAGGAAAVGVAAIATRPDVLADQTTFVVLAALVAALPLALATGLAVSRGARAAV